MPNYRRTRAGGATYFFTVVTYQRRPLLCLDENRSILKDVIAEVANKYPFIVDAWVLLPDHMHCIWTMPGADGDYSIRWALIKREFTKRERMTPESGMRCREKALWQQRFWEHQIRDEGDYKIHMDYIHFNPVKHGLAKSPRDWPHSTFHKCVRQGLYKADWGYGGDIALPDDIGRA